MKVPDWITRTIIITVITALIGGAFAWAQVMSTSLDVARTKNATQDTELKNINEKFDQLLVNQRRMEDKLDRALERRNP